MSIKLIAACDKNYGIGFQNQLLFRIKEDMKRFKDLTSGHFVVMGRKTFESLPAPLPNRKNVVLTRNTDYQAPKNVIVEHSVDRILNYYLNTGEQDKDLWIIGGHEIYKEFLPYANEVYLTFLWKDVEHVDTWFPQDAFEEKFTLNSIQKRYSEEHDCNFAFATFDTFNYKRLFENIENEGMMENE